MNSHMWWYLARGSGLVATGVLTATVAFGIVFSTRLFGRAVAPAWLLDLHWFLGGLSLCVLGVHIGALMLDGYVHFGVVDVTVPMAASWRPGAVAWGVVAMWILLAVEISSLLRRHISTRVWRIVHRLSAIAFIATLAHAATAGSDTRGLLCEICGAVAVGTVVFLTLVRVLAGRPQSGARARRQQPGRAMS